MTFTLYTTVYDPLPPPALGFGDHRTEAKVLDATGWSVGRRMFLTNSSSSFSSSTYTSFNRFLMVVSDLNLSQYGVTTPMIQPGAGRAPFQGTIAFITFAAENEEEKAEEEDEEDEAEAGMNPQKGVALRRINPLANAGFLAATMIATKPPDE